jgi:hypothetical protein
MCHATGFIGVVTTRWKEQRISLAAMAPIDYQEQWEMIISLVFHVMFRVSDQPRTQPDG